MNKIYEEITDKEYDMNGLIELINNQYHKIQYNIFKSVLEPRIEAKTNNKTRPNLDDKDIQVLNIPPDIFKKLYADLIHRWEAKQQQQPQPAPKPKPKPTLQPKALISAQDYILNEIVMKETDPTPKTKEEIDLLTTFYRRGRENIETIYDYYLQQHKIRFQPKPKNLLNLKKLMNS